MSERQRTVWLDVSAGVAGDMILAALVDAGASLEFIQAEVEAVLAGALVLSVEPVTRAGMRASRLVVSVIEQDSPPRAWRDIERLLTGSDLDAEVRSGALAVFRRLATAESRVHGRAPDDVHFHEVGAVDSIADVVGTCAGLRDLGVNAVVAGPIALGSGTVPSGHGVLPVPVPAVLEMVAGWTVLAGGSGELATPTGVALVTTLATVCGPVPTMRVDRVGIGAGTRDSAGRANVVRVVVGVAAPGEERPSATESRSVIVEANVDDLDPRVWPSVIAALLDAGAQDAWLTPMVMKKGRPAHTVHVLGRPEDVAELRSVLLEHTGTFGVRSYEVDKYALPRSWVPVDVAGHVVRVKVAHSAGVVRQVTPEFDDAEQVARKLGLPVREVLRLMDLGAARAGIVVGRPFAPPPTG